MAIFVRRMRLCKVCGKPLSRRYYGHGRHNSCNRKIQDAKRGIFPRYISPEGKANLERWARKSK